MKKAIVLGGTHDHISLIKKLKERGYYNILIDYYKNPPAKEFANLHLQESALDYDTVLDIARNEEANLVIATCIDQALLISARVSEELGLPCHITYKQAQEVTDKSVMKGILCQNDIATSVFQNIYKSSEIISTQLRYPLVVKPADANSSKGVQKVENFSDARQAIINALTFSRTQTVVLEEFIDGIEISADVIILAGKVKVLMISENQKSNLNTNKFTIALNIFRHKLYEKYKNKVELIAYKIAKAFNINNSPLLIQLLVKDDELYVIEFSSRIGGGSKIHLIKKVTGFDIIEFTLANILNETLNIHYSSYIKYAAIKYIYAQKGNFCYIDGTHELLKSNIIEDFFMYKSFDTQINNNISSTDRIMGFLSVAHNELQLHDKIKKAFYNIKIINELGQNIKLNDL